MYNDNKDRELNRLRQRRFKEKFKGNASVTEEKRKSNGVSSSSSSSSNKENITQLKSFETFWMLYPKRNGRKVTRKESFQFFKDNFKTEEEIGLLFKATENYSKSDEAKKNFARDAIRFLKKDFWRDWIEVTNAKPSW